MTRSRVRRRRPRSKRARRRARSAFAQSGTDVVEVAMLSGFDRSGTARVVERTATGRGFACVARIALSTGAGSMGHSHNDTFGFLWRCRAWGRLGAVSPGLPATSQPPRGTRFRRSEFKYQGERHAELNDADDDQDHDRSSRATLTRLLCLDPGLRETRCIWMRD